jgi:hypothetical protein
VNEKVTVYNGHDTTLCNKLVRLNFDLYKFFEVDSSFSSLGDKYSIYIISTLTPGYVDYLIFKFGSNISLDIAVNDLNKKNV